VPLVTICDLGRSAVQMVNNFIMTILQWCHTVNSDVLSYLSVTISFLFDVANDEEWPIRRGVGVL